MKGISRVSLVVGTLDCSIRALKRMCAIFLSCCDVSMGEMD